MRWVILGFEEIVFFIGYWESGDSELPMVRFFLNYGTIGTVSNINLLLTNSKSFGFLNRTVFLIWYILDYHWFLLITFRFGISSGSCYFFSSFITALINGPISSPSFQTSYSNCFSECIKSFCLITNCLWDADDHPLPSCQPVEYTRYINILNHFLLIFSFFDLKETNV